MKGGERPLMASYAAGFLLSEHSTCHWSERWLPGTAWSLHTNFLLLGALILEIDGPFG